MIKKHKGFTLIELLVVIAIIGILASIVLASLSSARKKSRDARRVADFGQIKTALELYLSDNTTYPITNTWAGLATALTGANCGGSPCIPALTNDPSPASTYNYQSVDSAGDACDAPATLCDSYVFKAVLEENNAALNSDVDGTIAGVDCGDPSDGVSTAFFYCLSQ
ncbi:MAG: type II secretion system protein [bacterium]|nr:type II secretion system protein [bacterium]